MAVSNDSSLKSLAFVVDCWNSSIDDSPVDYKTGAAGANLPPALRSWKRLVLVVIERNLHDAFQQGGCTTGSPKRRATLFGSVLQTYRMQAGELALRKSNEYHYVGEERLINQRKKTSSLQKSLPPLPAKSVLLKKHRSASVSMEGPPGLQRIDATALKDPASSSTQGAARSISVDPLAAATVFAPAQSAQPTAQDGTGGGGSSGSGGGTGENRHSHPGVGDGDSSGARAAGAGVGDWSEDSDGDGSGGSGEGEAAGRGGGESGGGPSRQKRARKRSFNGRALSSKRNAVG